MPDRQHFNAQELLLVKQTRRSVNLENANMPDQKVYIVSNKTLLRIVTEGDQ